MFMGKASCNGFIARLTVWNHNSATINADILRIFQKIYYVYSARMAKQIFRAVNCGMSLFISSRPERDRFRFDSCKYNIE